MDKRDALTLALARAIAPEMFPLTEDTVRAALKAVQDAHEAEARPIIDQPDKPTP